VAIAARIRHRLDERLAAWVLRRQGADSLPVEIGRRRLYVLPTRAGIGFGVLLFGMLLAGLNYANSLALFLTFLLAGLVLAAMHMCHGNLLGCRIVAARVSPTFAGEEGRLELVVEADGATRHDWSIAIRDGDDVVQGDPVQVNPGVRASMHLHITGARRGVHPLDRVRLTTTWPFGLFRCWTWLHLPCELIVYPAARGSLPLRTGGGRRHGQHERASPGDEEWRGLRAYRDGDVPRRIAWKAYARGGPLLVGEYAAIGSDRHEFDFDSLAPLGLEARLEQLSRWIVDAEQHGEPYSLRLPQTAIATGRGALHRHRCLTALARVPT